MCLDFKINFNFVIQLSLCKDASATSAPSLPKKFCKLSFKNFRENINLAGFPAGIICSVRLVCCSTAGSWPQRGELLSGPAVYCTSPLCSSSSFISSYLPLPALFFTSASLRGKKKKGKKSLSLLEGRCRWLLAFPSCPTGRHLR